MLIYNDTETRDYLEHHYSQHISDGRLRIASYFEDRVFNDGSRWSCGYVKHLAHSMATGRVLFNLDADNFIDQPLHETLLSLPDNTILINQKPEFNSEGQSGRIGVHRNLYGKTGYRDCGRNDDGDFMYRCFQLNARIRKIACQHTPISNLRTQ